MYKMFSSFFYRNCICGIEHQNQVQPWLDSWLFVDGNKYAWMVAVRKKVDSITYHYYSYFTGTLVSDQFIVTVASAFENSDNPDLFEAKPGATKWITEPDSNNSPEVMGWEPIDEILIHPYYKSRDNVKPSTELSYNVALMKMTNKVIFFKNTKYLLGVRPICLPTPKQTRIENLVGKEVIKGRDLVKDKKVKILDHQDCLRKIPDKRRYVIALLSVVII